MHLLVWTVISREEIFALVKLCPDITKHISSTDLTWRQTIKPNILLEVHIKTLTLNTWKNYEYCHYYKTLVWRQKIWEPLIDRLFNWETYSDNVRSICFLQICIPCWMRIKFVRYTHTHCRKNCDDGIYSCGYFNWIKGHKWNQTLQNELIFVIGIVTKESANNFKIHDHLIDLSNFSSYLTGN